MIPTRGPVRFIGSTKERCLRAGGPFGGRLQLGGFPRLGTLSHRPGVAYMYVMEGGVWVLVYGYG